MRRPSLLVLWTTALTATCAHADEFSWQISGSVRESDLGRSVEAQSGTLAATYFFRPVDDADGPYALAPFLDRSSSLGASYNEDKTTTVVPVFTYTIPFLPPPPPSPPATIVNRGTSRSLWGRHVWRTTGWYAGASLAETEATNPPLLSTSFSVLGDDLTTALARARQVRGPLDRGRALARSRGNHADERHTAAMRLRALLAHRVGADHDQVETNLENIEVSALHVGRLGSLRYSLAGGITCQRTHRHDRRRCNAADAADGADVSADAPVDDSGRLSLWSAPIATGWRRPRARERNERYALAGELFPTQGLGIRLGYARWDGDEPLGESFELGATWFFKPSIGAQVVLSRTKSELPISTMRDVDTVALQLIGRL